MADQTVERVAGRAQEGGLRPLGVPRLADGLHVVAERLVRAAKGLRTGLHAVPLGGEVVEDADALNPGVGPGVQECGVALGQIGEVAADMRPAIGACQPIEPLVTLPAVATEDAGRVAGVVLVQAEDAAGDGGERLTRGGVVL